MNIIVLDNTLSNNLSITIDTLSLSSVDNIDKKIFINKQSNTSSYSIIKSKLTINDSDPIKLPILS